MNKSIGSYLRLRKKYKEMKLAAKIVFAALYDVSTKTLVELQNVILEDGNMNYLNQMEKDGVYGIESLIYSLWYYKNNDDYNISFGKLWLDEIHNVYYKKLIKDNVPKEDINTLIKHINLRYGEYNTSSNPISLLQKNIISDHNIEGINLLDLNNLGEDVIFIHLYIKIFAKNLDTNLNKFILEINSI